MTSQGPPPASSARRLPRPRAVLILYCNLPQDETGDQLAWVDSTPALSLVM